MYSDLAAAYDIYMALSVFHQYCIYHPVIMTDPRTIHVYCNNKGVLNHDGRKSTIQHPRDAISNDDPVYAELQATIAALQPIQVQLQHVLGHQDTKLDKLLTLPEKLNIECDAQTTMLTPYHDATQLQTNPITNGGYPHLRLEKKLM